MTTLSQLTRLLRAHIWRLQFHEWLDRLARVAVIWMGVAVFVVLIAWLTPFPHHALWVIGGATVALVVAVIWTMRNHRAVSIWRRLDAAFAWSASVSTAVEVLQHPAQFRPVMAAQQLVWTQHLIEHTAADTLRLATRRQYIQIGVAVVVTIVAWAMPTPFDELLAQRQAVQSLANTVRDSLQADVAQMPSPPAIMDAMVGMADSQTPADLMAALSQVQNEVAQSQRDTTALQQLVRDMAAAPDQATRQQLWSAARAAGMPLDTVIPRESVSDLPPALDSEQWQDMIAAVQARAQAEQRLQNTAQAAKQAARALEPGNPSLAAATTGAGNTSAATESNTSDTTAAAMAASDPRQAVQANNAAQNNGQNAANATQTNTSGSGQSGSGSAIAGLDEFWAQGTTNAVLDLRDDTVIGQRDVVQVRQDTDPGVVTQRYQELVIDARQQAQQAIQQADIPWITQPLVDAYFAALQEP